MLIFKILLRVSWLLLGPGEIFCYSMRLERTFSKNRRSDEEVVKQMKTPDKTYERYSPMANLMSKTSEILEEATKEIKEMMLSDRSKREIETFADEIEEMLHVSSSDSDLSGQLLLADTDADLALGELFDQCIVAEGECDSRSRFRSFTGQCNNLLFPATGATLTKLGRLLPSEYEDDVSAPRSRSLSGMPLPNPRTVSSLIHENMNTADEKHTLMVMQWGQFIDHDLALTPQYRGPGNTLVECSECDSAFINRGCYPILVPSADSFYPTNTSSPRCMKFVRSLPGQQRLGAREQLNSVSHYLDASMVYGSDACQAAELREEDSFLMKMTRYPGSSDERPMKDLLPLTPHNPECRAADSQCFMAGDERVNEQPGLTVMHTMFVREHNNIASHLASINPHWSDERVFQETRRIIIAMIQHITYSEFLPRVLGDVFMPHYQLSLKNSGYHQKYNPECGGTIFNEFATAAFRFGHSLIKSNLSLLSEEDMEAGGPYLQVILASHWLISLNI